MTSAKVIADSIAPNGSRVTTMEVTMHRFVLAEFNTHRMFSRNSASSRAIPLEKQIKRIREGIANPVLWPTEQPGMQGGAEIDAVPTAIAIWSQAADDAIANALLLRELRVHKSVINRLLEPFMWHTVIVTSTEWGNFFGLRCHEMAQPEIRVAADLMRDAYDDSTPREIDRGQWHLPYVTAEEEESLSPSLLRHISVARCAWVSTMSHDGDHSLEACQRMFDRLSSAVPMHASPLEHQASPMLRNDEQIGNLIGWVQYRHLVERSKR